MKKTILIALVMLFGTMVFSQDDKLPSKINTAFEAKYPKVKNINWYVENDNYKIDFEIASDTYTAVYSKEGTWVETSKVISDTDVPVKAIAAINKKYPDSEISYAEFVENGKGEKFYRINSYTEDADYTIYVTMDGTILKAEKQISESYDDEV